MKVLFCSTFYGQNIGGAEISIKEQKKLLEKKKIEVPVVSLRKGTINLKPFNRFPKKALILGNKIMDRLIEKKLKKIIKDIKPDLIHIQDLYLLNAAANLNIKKIVTVRDTLPKVMPKKSRLKKIGNAAFKIRNKRWIESLNKCDKIIAISKFIKNNLIEQGIKKEKIDVIYNPVSIKKIKKIKNKKITIFCPARLTYEKGIHTLIMSIKNIKEDILVLIAGSGPCKDDFKKLIDKHNQKNKIKLLGKLDYDKIQSLYANSDIVTIPSILPEPFGRVTVEAMAHKKPVVGTNAGAIPEAVINNKTGFIVNVGSESELAKKFIKLIKNKDLRKKFGNNGYNLYKSRFNQEIKNLIKIYKK